MHAVILIGLPAAGKSTFCQQRFADTHVRLNLDSLRTRRREATLLEACILDRRPFVVDNTNASVAERARFIVPAQAAGYNVVGYYFRSVVADCLERNRLRSGPGRVPDAAVLGTAGRLRPPSLAEGFTQLWYVSQVPRGGFAVEEWRDEVHGS